MSGVAAAKPLKIARSFFGKWWRAELTCMATSSSFEPLLVAERH